MIIVVLGLSAFAGAYLGSKELTRRSAEEADAGAAVSAGRTTAPPAVGAATAAPAVNEADAGVSGTSLEPLDEAPSPRVTAAPSAPARPRPTGTPRPRPTPPPTSGLDMKLR